jgi:hypothetical protein
MTTKTLFASFFAALALLPLGAAGSEGGKGGDPFAACAEDKERLCSGVEAGGGKIAECMFAHADEVSWECRAILEKKRSMEKKGGKGKAGAWPCDADKERLCGDVEWGGGRVLACLAENEAKLSKSCRAEVAKKKKGEKKPKP